MHNNLEMKNKILSQDFSEYYKKIVSIFFSELTTGELLEKDLKIVSGNKVKIAMSSVSMELQVRMLMIIYLHDSNQIRNVWNPGHSRKQESPLN